VVEETIKPMPGVNVEAKLRELRAKLKEVGEYSKAAEASFAEVARHIKEHKLPAEILSRHEAAVKEYETRKTEFESLAQAVIDTDDARTLPGALNALAAFFAEYPMKNPTPPPIPTSCLGAPRTARYENPSSQPRNSRPACSTNRACTWPGRYRGG
jgi:hypothetical protein